MVVATACFRTALLRRELAFAKAEVRDKDEDEEEVEVEEQELEHEGPLKTGVTAAMSE